MSVEQSLAFRWRPGDDDSLLSLCVAVCGVAWFVCVCRLHGFVGRAMMVSASLPSQEVFFFLFRSLKELFCARCVRVCFCWL